MSKQIEDVIAKAAADLGYKENPPNSNKTKYGKWYGMDGQPWCMMAVQYWFNQAGLSDLLYRTASCTTLMNYAKKSGKWFTSGFQRGDVVLFDFDNDKTKSEHVGIITGFTSGNVQTIEGNTSTSNDSDGGEVMRRTRPYAKILGVYRPDYKEDEMTQEQFEAMYKTMMDKLAKQEVNPNIAPGEFAAAVKAGITDGSRPQSPATRQEVAVMVLRGSGQ